MNVFNLISAGGGKSEGLYIWKKYEYIAEQTIVNPTMRVYKTFSTNIRLEAINFDIRPLPSAEKSNYTYICANDNANSKTVCDFLDGFGDFKVSVPEKTLSIIWVKGNNAGSGITKVEHASYDANLVNLSLYTSYSGTYDKTVTYEGTKTLPPAIGDMLGYVISDKEDAYPDGGEQGGFYYERYAPYSLDDLGCSKFETGSVNYTSTQTYISINHSLGVVPKFAIIYKTDDKKHYLDYEIYAFTSPNGTYGGGAGTSTYASEQAYSGTSAEASSTTIWLGYNGRNSNWHFYGAYSYIILA